MSQQETKSKTFKRAEKNLQNKFSIAFLKNYPHHLMPGYNLNKSSCIEEYDEENVIGLFQEFPYNCDLPKPLLPPAKLPRAGILILVIVENYLFFRLIFSRDILEVLCFSKRLYNDVFYDFYIVISNHPNIPNIHFLSKQCLAKKIQPYNFLLSKAI